MTSFDLTERAQATQFTQPVRQILTMLIVLALVGLGVGLILPSIAPVFMANPYLNGAIVFVFVVGVLACFYQVLQLISSVSWIENFAQGRPGHDNFRAPRLLVSLATLLRARGARMQIGSSSARTILDSVATRMEEARDITRYIVNLLIFLGLLGTFYGLATTVPEVVNTIQSLKGSTDDSGVAVFDQLLTGLEGQLDGMGVAFASSLLGLAGSLIVGLLELFAGHGQNRFYRELEDWLSTITRIGIASNDGEGGGVNQDAVAAVLDQMLEQIDGLQGLFIKTEEGRKATDDRLSAMIASIEGLTEKLDVSIDPTEALQTVAEGQDKLVTLLSDGGGGGAGVDAESRMRLRSIDVQLLKILEELAAGRQESVQILHNDLSTLSDAVRRLAREQQPPVRMTAPRRD